MKSNLIFVLCACLWGTSTFINRIAAKNVSPFIMQIIVGIIYILYIPIAIRTIGIENLKINFLNASMILISTTISLVANILLYMAIRQSETSSVMLVSLYPAVSVVLAVVFLNESLSLFKIIGIITMVVGAVILNIK